MAGNYKYIKGDIFEIKDRHVQYRFEQTKVFKIIGYDTLIKEGERQKIYYCKRLKRNYEKSKKFKATHKITEKEIDNGYLE